MEFEASNNVLEDNATVEVYTNLKLLNGDKPSLKLSVKFVGFFSTNQEDENMNLGEFVNNSSLALMYPYIREHITSITSKAGIKPIMLPPINLRAMINKDKEISQIKG